MAKYWSKQDTLWSFALYGTAVGAGTLFLPIQLGSSGTIVLLLTALVAWPMTYWPHKALSQFIISAPIDGRGDGITAAVKSYYGKKVGNILTILYFIAFLVIILIYAVAITNSLLEQLAAHHEVNQSFRVMISLVVVLGLNLIFLMGRYITIKVMGFLVFPLIGYFLFLSCYLIRYWQPDLINLHESVTPNTLHQIWLSIPVMVFAFSHTPIISTFTVAQRERFGDAAMKHCSKIMKVAYFIICLSVLFFVFSCYLSIPSSFIQEAKAKGLPVLSALSMQKDSPSWLAISGFIVAIIALSKSFLGTYFGVIEGATELTSNALKQLQIRKSYRFNRILSILMVSAITFTVCCINPNALSMIYKISGPLIAMILFIMPTLSAWLVPALKPFRSLSYLIILLIGLTCVSVMFIS
jgi:serine transporter